MKFRTTTPEVDAPRTSINTFCKKEIFDRLSLIEDFVADIRKALQYLQDDEGNDQE